MTLVTPVTVVVKVGTSLVAGSGGRVRRSLLRARGSEIGRIVGRGEPVCVVSSGAIALGLPRLGLSRRPRSVAQLQAASALGQARLHAAWEAALAPVAAAQVLLTASDVGERTTYVNARSALGALLRLGAVPVVNENDTTATDEITFGDNDALAAQVAVLLRARLLVLLTEVAGVYSRAPGTPGAELLAEGRQAREAVLGDASPLGRGGMRSKVLAAELAAAAGIPTVIAGGVGDAVLEPILAGEPRGTRFAAAERSESAFKLWLRFGKPVRGRITVDDGARRALVEGGASLLGVGILSCDGAFEPGDAVELLGPEGAAFAKGIASVSVSELAGRARGVEAVHRDRLVIYGAPTCSCVPELCGSWVGALPPYVFAAINELKLELRRAGEDVVDLGFGNPDLPSPEVAVEKLREAVLNPRNHRYSASRGIPNLRRAICDLYERRFGVVLDPERQALTTIGAKEGLAHLMWVLVQPGDSALVPSPSYPIHLFAPAFAGAVVEHVRVGEDEDVFGNVVEAYERAPTRPRVLVLSFPHNPTTAVVDAGFMQRVVDFARERELLVVHDFAYADLAFDGHVAPSILQAEGGTEVAVELYTLTKSFSMAGWRVGFVVGNAEVVQALARLKSYLDYGTFQPIQIASIVAMNEAPGYPAGGVRGVPLPT